MSGERLPDFFIVGAAKSGTTSLWQYLGQHPGIYMTDDIAAKELGYFCHFYGIKKKANYVHYFKNAEPAQLIGESCHAYLSSPESAEMIYREIPNAKIIIVLRNPIDRAYSLYNWMASNGYEPASSFEKALELEEERFASESFKTRNPQGYYMNYQYVRSGMYFEQISRYFNRFGRDSCKIILFDDLKKNPVKYVHEICDFLGLQKFNPRIEIHNEGQQVKSSARQYYLKFELPKKIGKLGFSPQLARRLSDRLMKFNISSDKVLPMQRQTREELITRFTSDIRQTGILIGKDLSFWLKC